MLSLFLAGLFGGLTHCAGMCGPFVMAQVNGKSSGAAAMARLSEAALLPYHLGRMTTYMILGGAAAMLSKQIMGTPLQHWASVVFLSLAGFIFIASAMPAAKRLLSKFRSEKYFEFGSAIGKAGKPLMANPLGINGYGLGLLLGLLPCGLVFGALMIVSTTGEPISAMMAMALFTIGTFPALFLVGHGSRFSLSRWPQATTRIARGMMVLNGLSLFVLVGNMVF